MQGRIPGVVQRKGLTLSLAKERQIVLELLSHSVSSQVTLVTRCLQPSCAAGFWEHLQFFFCFWKVMKNWVLPIPSVPSVTLFPSWLCALSSSLLLNKGDKEQRSSPNPSKALPSPLSQFSSMMCAPYLLCSHSHPHSGPSSSCIMLLYAPSLTHVTGLVLASSFLHSGPSCAPPRCDLS